MNRSPLLVAHKNAGPATPTPSTRNPTSPISVLRIADDEPAARTTSLCLEAHAIHVTLVTSGREAIARTLRERPDLVLVDVDLPDTSGLAVCLELHARVATPIVLVAACHDEAQCVCGLEGGADDYLIKPLSPRELVARIRAHVRRARGLSLPNGLVRVGSLKIDLGAVRAFMDGVELPLTGYEFRLLRVLAERPNRALCREELTSLVRGRNEEAFDRSIDTHICRLRQKLREDPKGPKLVKTIRGVGYMLVAPEAALHPPRAPRDSDPGGQCHALRFP
jgi:DNA-binding response OmpR family regulator